MFTVLAIFASATLRVGPEQPFSSIEAAVKAAKPGDQIVVSAGTYSRVAVLIDKPRLSIFAEGEVKLIGTDFDYSGVGSVPRAIIQLQPSASNCQITGFDLSGAHNTSHNGAGFRINGANDVTISNCHIHGNDMGIMSNETSGNLKSCSRLKIEHCEIDSNGDRSDPGYNHNLYLGGDSVYILECNIHHAVTGHNVKSRAHYTEIRSSFIHDSANRECDFVESAETVPLNSNAAILGCVIAKDPNCSGNRGTINFGKEKGTRNGSLYLIDNEISSPFQTAFVTITSDASLVYAYKNDLKLDRSSELLNGNYILSGKYNTVIPKDLSNRIPTPPDFFGAFKPKSAAPVYTDGEGVAHPFTGVRLSRH